ncbi:MAG: AraC family transcriptional regulator [Rhizobiales bacterium]|nr:AraC family transcriptional regulator [Hyphomicrobiales bacterium]
MQLETLSPSPKLELRSFSDIDEFRPVELLSACRSIPTDMTKFAPIRAVVHLPQLSIVVQRSFPRLLDSMYQIAGSLILVPLDDKLSARVNGHEMDARSFIALHGRTDCQILENNSNQHATLIFSETLKDRDWFNDRDKLVAKLAERSNLGSVRQALVTILQVASKEPHLLKNQDFARQLQEMLLLQVDILFLECRPYGRFAQGDRAAQIIRRLDEYVSTRPTAMLYSQELADECSVSARTLNDVLRQVRGMSLHRYLRHGKLHALRRRLLKGGDGVTVSDCAKAYGFYHLGGLSMLYRATFNELPSATLMRSRQ